MKEQTRVAPDLTEEKAWAIYALAGMPAKSDENMSHASFDTSNSCGKRIRLDPYILSKLYFRDNDDKFKGKGSRQ